LAPVPGTLDADASSRHGRIGIPIDCSIVAIHFHYDHPAGTGQYDLEIYRIRSGVPLLIATVSDDGSSGDFGVTNFVFEDEGYRDVEAWDYLMLQSTSVMTGGGAKNAVGFVDIHFGVVNLYPI